MRILHVNKFLYRRGGAEAYMQDVADHQVEAGHEVEFFASGHPDNVASRFSSSFPPYIELDPPPAGLTKRAVAVGRMLSSRPARAGIEDVLDAFAPDVVHLHNVYHHLSPSILGPIGRRSAVVMTLHDYNLVCPTHNLLAAGKVCEACVGGRFHHAVLRRCQGGAIGASTVVAVESFVHRTTRAYGSIQSFICPSRFMLDKMRQAGVYPDRLRHLPHPVATDRIRTRTGPGRGVLYAGRLHDEKGILLAIEAAGLLGESATLDVAGDGPLRQEAEDLAARVAPGRVTFHGLVPVATVHELMRQSAVLVFPSRCYENQPLAVLEAFATATPVVGCQLGGVPELIEPGVVGELAPPNNPAALASALRRVLDNPGRAAAMGCSARERVERDFSMPGHLNQLDLIYQEAVDGAGRHGAAATALSAHDNVSQSPHENGTGNGN